MNTPTSSRVPKGFEIKSHYHSSDLKRKFKINLCAYGRQNQNSWEEGHDIKKYLSNPLCDCVLDRLLDHPDRIPSDWKGKLVFFWGTVYKVSQQIPVGAISPGGVQTEAKVIGQETQYVRFLFMSQGIWQSEFLSLDDEFGPTRLSAELAPQESILKRLKNIFMWTTARR